MTRQKISTTGTVSLTAFVTALMFVSASLSAVAQTETVIHSFQSSNKNDGSDPSSGLVADKLGALYGVTANGGKHGRGEVYKLTAQGGAWTETPIYSFTGGLDGGGPSGNLLIKGSTDRIYGTAPYGGSYGYGVVYELTPSKSWTETVLYSFNLPGGIYPAGGVISDSKGALYGVAAGGVGRTNYGAIFRLTQAGGAWTEKLIYKFTGGGDGAYPNGGLIWDSSGSLYGTTFNGAQVPRSAGTVFRLSPPGINGQWTLTTLYTFTGGVDGGYPAGGVVFDGSGALYGTTSFGGDAACLPGLNCGTVFQLTPPSGGSGPWTESVLYNFTAGSDGGNPEASLIFDNAGALYSTTAAGGDLSSTCGSGPGGGCGTVFKLSPPSASGLGWTESVLYAFQGSSDGTNPFTPVLMVGNDLFGTTSSGGGAQNGGIAFEVTP